MLSLPLFMFAGFLPYNRPISHPILGQVRTWTWGCTQTASPRGQHWAQSPQEQGLNPWAHNRRWACPAHKHGRSIDMGTSSEYPCPKEWCTERGRSHEHRHINSPEHLPPPLFLSTPATPRCTTTGSLRIRSLDMSRGFVPWDRGGMDTEGPVSSTGMATPSHAHQPVLSSGQLANAQVDSVIATSGLTEAVWGDIPPKPWGANSAWGN